MKRRKYLIPALVVFAGLSALVYSGITHELSLVNYTMESKKVKNPLRIVQLSDLHSCFYGDNQQQLIDAIHQQKPDLILLTGDIADDEMPHEGTRVLLSAIAQEYPCYYVTGNHEVWTKELDLVKNMFRRYGVTVLDGDCQVFTLGDTSINLCGVDDPETGLFVMQLNDAFRQAQPELFTILLSHRPERVDTYDKYPVDLVLAGHAHGGQWRVPGLLNGLLAPNQGLFPRLAGGLYTFDDFSMIVSRGLAKESTRIPRLWNPPELVVIDILPE